MMLIRFTGVHKFLHLKLQHSWTLWGRVFRGQFVIFAWWRSSWQTTCRNCLQLSLHWNDDKNNAKLLLNILWLCLSNYIYLAPTTGSPFRTTLLRTISNIHWLFINTITIINHLIGRFTNASYVSKTVTSVTCSWTWWPSAGSPNESLNSKRKFWKKEPY